MKNVLTLDEAIQEIELAQVTKTPVAKRALPSRTEKKDPGSPKDNSSKIANDAKSTLSFYINKIPDVKIIDKQIELLKKEMVVYAKNGSTDNYEKSKTFLTELIEKRDNINRIFSRKGYSVKDANRRAETIERVKNSPELKALKIRQTQLEKQLKETNPNSIMGNYNRIKKQMKLIESINNDEILELDDFVDLPEGATLSQLEQEHYDYSLFIGKIINKKIVEINAMKASEIHALLKENLKNNNIVKEELTKVKMEASHIKNKLSETVTVTEIIHNIFDFKNDTTGGKIPKEILASTHVGLVNAIAYKVAVQQGKLHELNDAVCGGLLGLTVAINKWYVMQKLSDTPLSFQDFANLHILNYAKRALYELGTTGTTGSGKATLDTHEKQKFADFVKYNPQFADMDKNVLIDMLDSIDSSNKSIKVVTETDYNAIVGGEDDSADIWSLNSFDSNGYDADEARENYTRLIRSIGKLMELFETKENNKTGLAEVTSKRMFDKYDRKIFMMYFGIDFKRDRNDTDSTAKVKSEYTQEEMAAEIEAMFRVDGQLNREGQPKTMSQPALNARITKILKNLKTAMDFNAELKAGFEYLYNYYLANKEALVDMSNYREEIGISIDREDLREIYMDDEQQLNRQLTDGKRLSDQFEITETNPFDDEIAGLFNEYI